MLRREVKGRAVLEMFLAIVVCAAIAGTIFDRQARSGDAIGAALIAIVLLIGRINPDRTASWRAKRARRHASRPRRSYTARKRRAVGIVVVVMAYVMVRPDRNGNVAVAIAYSLVFCGLILAAMNVRTQHFVSVFRRLTGRLRSGK